jgi:ParB family chromosome partitioning protein
MMALGRGLGELLGEVEIAYDNSNSSGANINDESIILIEVDKIKPNPNQPRKIFDETKLQELGESIKEHGLLQPITVRYEDGEYTLVAGERRLRAHKLAGLDAIKATVIEIDGQKLRELALIENIQRDDLNVIELAYSYAQLINEHNLTHDELSGRVFKSRSSITNTLRLLQLGVYAQQMLGNDKISAGHAKVLIGLSDDDQKLVVDSIIGQKLSVRETEKLVQQLKNPAKKPKGNKSVTKIDFKPIENIIDRFKSDNLKVKTADNYIKIELNSQEDIDKLSKYFQS